MKRVGFFLLIALFLAGTVFAQNRNNRPRDNNSVTVNGALQLQRGSVVVASGDDVYFVPMLTRYIGFIEGLKEGSQVSVEGYESGNVIRPTKVTIAGKSYDFLGAGGGPGGMGGPGFRDDNFGRGRSDNFGRGGRGGFGPRSGGRGMQGSRGGCGYCW